MSIKILRIIARLNIGGPARNAVLLTEGLRHASCFMLHASRKYETVLVCGEVDKYEGDMMYLAMEKGIEPVIVKELSRELSLKDDWKALWKIYKIICKEKPDIVHTHTAKAGTIGRLAVLLYNVAHCLCNKASVKCKVVHTFHGHVLHSYFGRVKTYFFIWIEKILALFTDRIITVSDSLEKELIERFRIAPKKKFSVVELGFELDELLRLQARKNSDCVNIGIIGRLVPVKNHRMLFRAAHSIVHRAESIAYRIKFIVIGDGQLREELEKYIKEIGIEEIVEFKGWVRDLRKIYEELDIVALTSLNEGTPVSIIEAMAAARPVVATEVGGVKDVVQDGENGYLVDSNDDVAFSERLLDLVKDSERRKRFGEYGRGLVKDRFSKERLIKDMEGLCNSVLQERYDNKRENNRDDI